MDEINPLFVVWVRVQRYHARWPCWTPPQQLSLFGSSTEVPTSGTFRCRRQLIFVVG